MGARVSSRQEIAERLREKHRERNAPVTFEAQDVGMQAYDYLHDLIDCLPDGESAFTVIADLIDPTCHKVIPSEIEGYVFCSKCGAEIGEYGVPNYCHNCGARVVGR